MSLSYSKLVQLVTLIHTHSIIPNPNSGLVPVDYVCWEFAGWCKVIHANINTGSWWLLKPSLFDARVPLYTYPVTTWLAGIPHGIIGVIMTHYTHYTNYQLPPRSLISCWPQGGSWCLRVLSASRMLDIPLVSADSPHARDSGTGVDRT